MELDRRQDQRHGHQHDKGRFQVDQAEHNVRAKSDTDANGSGQIASGAAVRLRRRGRWLSQH
jgi:hypothetical protein